MQWTKSVKYRPITAIALAALAVYCIWMAYSVFYAEKHFPPQRLVAFAGPESLWRLNIWVCVFLATGVVSLLRLFLLRPNPAKSEFLTHTITTFPVLLWCVSFITGPTSTGQPTSLLVLVWTVMIPFITPIMAKSQRERLRGSYSIPSDTVANWMTDTHSEVSPTQNWRVGDPTIPNVTQLPDPPE